MRPASSTASDPAPAARTRTWSRATLTIATGPVIAGTALRDAVGIQFGDFTNQIDYAKVANAINDRVKTDVIAKAGVNGLTGKKITFAGAFSSLTPGTIFLVPTELQAAA
jgi:predicted lipoprotein